MVALTLTLTPMQMPTGLFVMLRVGPYICAETRGGGLPSWLYSEVPRVIVRSSDGRFLDAVRSYWRLMLPLLRPLLYHRGGPIVAVQIENEYGNYAAGDADYMPTLRSMLLDESIDCLHVTADGAHEDSLRAGRVDGALATVTLRKDADRALRTLRLVQPTGPLFVVEFWAGWFDSWGAK